MSSPIPIAVQVPSSCGMTSKTRFLNNIKLMLCNIEHRGGLSARREKIARRGQVISGTRPRKKTGLIDQHAVRGEIGSYVAIRFSPSVAALFLRDKFFSMQIRNSRCRQSV